MLGEWCLRWLRRDRNGRASARWSTRARGSPGRTASRRRQNWPTTRSGSRPIRQSRRPRPPRGTRWRSGNTDKGSVPGIAGGVDMNRFDGTRAELVALGKSWVSRRRHRPSSSNDGDEIHGLRTALAHVCDVEAPRLALAAADATPRWRPSNGYASNTWGKTVTNAYLISFDTAAEVTPGATPRAGRICSGGWCGLRWTPTPTVCRRCCWALSTPRPGQPAGRHRPPGPTDPPAGAARGRISAQDRHADDLDRLLQTWRGTPRELNWTPRYGGSAGRPSQ